MNLNFQTSLSTPYTNNSQKIRAMSEPWTEQNIFCPNCGSGLSEQRTKKNTLSSVFFFYFKSPSSKLSSSFER